MDYINDIYEARREVINQFNENNSKTIYELNHLINRNIFHIVKLSIEAPKIRENWYGLECLKLLDHAIKISISCIDLFKELKLLELSILSRHIVELCATSIAISKDEEYLKEFLTDAEFASSKSFKIAKRTIPEIGNLWGMLSTELIHINPTNYGTRKTLEGEKLAIQFSLSVFNVITLNEEEKKIVVSYLKLILYLIQTTIEVIFFEPVKFKGLDGFKHPNNKDIILGASGYINFQKQYTALFKPFDLKN